MRYGIRASQRAYKIERAKYPEWKFQISLSSVKSVIEDLSKHFDVSIPSVRFRKMSRTLGIYRAHNRSITISRELDTIRFSTILHEFAHHLNFIKNSRSGHDKYFLNSLDKVYDVAKILYSSLREQHKESALHEQRRWERAKTDAWHRVLDAQSQFRIGQRVAFENRKNELVTCTVYRVNRTTITIKNCDNGSRGYRVSPNLLKIVEA